jgi:predicted enzyme related to lactoylglutathione lyase
MTLRAKRFYSAVAAAEANGGSVVTPTDVPGQGRCAVVTDSEGSEIGLWQNTTD